MNLLILVICFSWLNCLSPTVLTLGQNNSNASVRGEIFDNRFGLPVSGAKVTVLLERRILDYASSDERGVYEIKNLSEGQYTITAERLGFARTERIVQVKKGEQVSLDIALRIGHLHDPLPIEINGKVKLADDTSPGGVTILVMSPYDQEIVARTKTEQTGQYSLRVSDPGQYVLYALKSGFEVVTVAITLRPTLPRRPNTKDILLLRLNLSN